MALGTLFTISAPSGAGKTSLVHALLERDARTKLSISHTTRAKRPGEVDGQDYHFVTPEAFTKLVNQNAFLEHASVFGNYYGTASSSVESLLNSGKDVILEIDWQGAAQVRRQNPATVSIFILPPSRSTLEERLRSRAQDSEETITRRMAAAKNEIAHYAESDFLVINDDFEQALKELLAIITCERLRQKRQQAIHAELLNSLLS